MSSPAKMRYAAHAEIVKALAHPTRLFILDELSRGERCVQELTVRIGDDMSTVSKHLAVLRHVGILTDDKRGLKVFYRIRTECILQAFSCIENVLAARVAEAAETPPPAACIEHPVT